MSFMRWTFACCIFLLATSSLHAERMCGDKYKDSAAYYACESLKLQEQIEAKRERKEREQYLDDMNERYEREDRAKRAQSLENQKRKQLAELKPIFSGMETVETALKAGKCDQTQRVLDDIHPKIKNTKASYSLNGNVITREAFENAFVMLQSKVYLNCVAGPERIDKLHGYLEQESKNGNKAAKEMLAKTKDLMRAEIEKSSGQRGKNNNVPKISEYGTDMASLRKYDFDLAESNVTACQKLWKKKDADAAYCLAQQETGEKMIAMLREASKLGHPIAQRDLAFLLDNSKPPGNSLEISRLVMASANSGIPHAQVTVGWWHMTGEHGFKVDHAEAMKWNLKAYNQGHSEGANNIGELYEKGRGVPKDMEKAKSWYKKASVLGNAEATARLEKLRR